MANHAVLVVGKQMALLRADVGDDDHGDDHGI